MCAGGTHSDIRAEPPSARQRAAKAARCRAERSARSDHLPCCVCTHTFRGPETEKERGGKEGARERESSLVTKGKGEKDRLILSRIPSLKVTEWKLIVWLHRWRKEWASEKGSVCVCVCVFMRRVQVCNTESTITISLSFLRAGMPCTPDND